VKVVNMSVRSSLRRWEADIKNVERKLGVELSHVSKPKSLFGKHRYEIEQPLMKLAGVEAQRAISLIDDRLAVGQPSGLYSENERARFARTFLKRANMILEKWVGCH
jgi:hypothetical protein